MSAFWGSEEHPDFVKKAEGEGFEPPERGKIRSPDFESGTFDHSVNSPESPIQMLKCTFYAHVHVSGVVLRGKVIHIFSNSQNPYV